MHEFDRLEKQQHDFQLDKLTVTELFLFLCSLWSDYITCQSKQGSILNPESTGLFEMAYTAVELVL